MEPVIQNQKNLQTAIMFGIAPPRKAVEKRIEGVACHKNALSGKTMWRTEMQLDCI